MSLNDLMPYEDIVIGDGAGEEGGFLMDNPFANLPGIPTPNPLPFPSDPIGQPIMSMGRDLVKMATDGNTTLPIKHPKK
jgi:hypothetical protein